MAIEGNFLFVCFLWQQHCYIASERCTGGCSLGDGSHGGSPRAEHGWLIPTPRLGSRAAGGQLGSSPCSRHQACPWRKRQAKTGPGCQPVGQPGSAGQMARQGRTVLEQETKILQHGWGRQPQGYGNEVWGRGQGGERPWEPGNAHGALTALTHGSSLSLIIHDLATSMC